MAVVCSYTALHRSLLTQFLPQGSLLQHVIQVYMQANHPKALKLHLVLYIITSFLLHTVPHPGVNVTSVTSSQVVYETTAHGNTTRVIAGYEVTRFGVPMIGEYENTGRGGTVTISPAVPGAQYRITAWALGDGTRSATPAVVYVTTGEAG